jgi:hypothetical protein
MPLTPTQLESLQRLLLDPLKQTIRTEIQSGQDRLNTAIEKVADHLQTHITTTTESNRQRDAQQNQQDHRLRTLERFRGKILVVYAALTLLSTLAWSLLHDYLTSTTFRH